MRNCVPDLAVATLQPSQDRLIPKFGGLPWGFPQQIWPICRECDQPLALLAQLPHQQQRIVYLRYFEDRTQAEIAKELGISQMQVSRLLARSIATLGEGVPDEG